MKKKKNLTKKNFFFFPRTIDAIGINYDIQFSRGFLEKLQNLHLPQLEVLELKRGKYFGPHNFQILWKSLNMIRVLNLEKSGINNVHSIPLKKI